MNERMKLGGWVDPDTLPKDDTGRTLCRQCKAPVPPRRKTFCSKECVHEWKLRTQMSYLRGQVFARDRGVCAQCGIDTMAARSVYLRRARGTGHLWQADHIMPVVEGGGQCGLDNIQTLCTECHKKTTRELSKRMAAARRGQKAQMRLCEVPW